MRWLLLLCGLAVASIENCTNDGNFTTPMLSPEPVFLSTMIPQFTWLCVNHTIWEFTGWNKERKMLLCPIDKESGCKFVSWDGNFRIDSKNFNSNPLAHEGTRAAALSPARGLGSTRLPCEIYNQSEISAILGDDIITRMRDFTNRTTIRGVPILDVIKEMSRESTKIDSSFFSVAIVGGAVRDLIKKQSISDVDLALGMLFQDGVFRIRDIFKKRGIVIDNLVFEYISKRGQFGMMKVSEINNPTLQETDALDVGPFKTANYQVLETCKTERTNCLRQVKIGAKVLDECSLEFQQCFRKAEEVYLYGFGHDADFRDYSINAVYIDVISGTVLDCGTGSGVGDILNNTLRIRTRKTSSMILVGNFDLSNKCL